MGEIVQLRPQSYETYMPVAAGAEEFAIGLCAIPEVVPQPALDILCYNADEMVGLNSVRNAARLEANRILEQNRQNLMGGNFVSVPLDVDALGTAAKVSAIHEKY